MTAYDNLNLARDAFHLQDNAHCFHKAARGIADKATIDSREPTPAPEASAEAQYEAIILRFDKPPKDLKKGWQFGTSLRVSDVLLGHRGTPGISSCHFYITIDERGYVWLHDSSTHGTVVSHDGKLKKVILEHDKRLLAFEPGAQKQWEHVIVYVPEPKGLAFRIEFLNHRIAGREYQQNIQAFLKAREMALPCLDGLGLPFDSNPPTMPPSRQHRTLRKQPLQIDDGAIGRGQFGVVHKFIDMREGRVYAVKKFNTEASDRKRKLDQVDWFEAIRNEVKIMTKHPHVSMTPHLSKGQLSLFAAEHHASHQVSGETGASSLDAILSPRKPFGAYRYHAIAICKRLPPDPRRTPPPACAWRGPSRRQAREFAYCQSPSIYHCHLRLQSF